MRAWNDQWFLDFLLRLGDGTKESIEGSFIHIPNDMTVPCIDKENSVTDLIKVVFPAFQEKENVRFSDYLINRAILSTRNDCVDKINGQMIEVF